MVSETEKMQRVLDRLSGRIGKAAAKGSGLRLSPGEVSALNELPALTGAGGWRFDADDEPSGKANA